MLALVSVPIRLVRVSAIGMAFLLVACGIAAPPPPAPSSNSQCEPLDPDLPGLSVSAAPWPAELDHLEERLKAIGSPVLTREGRAIDLHFHLRVFVAGRPVKVPASVGLAGEEIAGGIMTSGFVTEMHTHDASGWVHIHAVAPREFLLGEFFDVWGVALTGERLGGYCADDGTAVVVFADGVAAEGNPRSVELTEGAAIVVTFGTDAELPDPVPAAPA